MVTYEIRILNMGEFIYKGDITLNGDKVDLKFLDKREQEFFETIAVGDRDYTPQDGKAYIDAMLMAFCRSSTIVISIKEER